MDSADVKPDLHRIDLADWVRSVIGTFRASGKKLQKQFRLKVPNPCVLADDVKRTRINNPLSNAIKFIGDSDTIAVGLKERRERHSSLGRTMASTFPSAGNPGCSASLPRPGEPD